MLRIDEKNNSIRELAYVVTIDEILPIEGADRVEVAKVGGWRVMVKKGQFKVGDPAIYFEIDSKVPEREPYMFLAPKHFKIKTQKYFRGSVISQGLLMAAEDLGWTVGWEACPAESENSSAVILDNKNIAHNPNDESRFLTKELEVTYAEASDNKRKSAGIDKYAKMASRKPKIFKKPWARWLMRREWGRKLMFALFGKKSDKRAEWPSWVVKTDEERIQNMPWIIEDFRGPWIQTEKVDGSSTTFTYKRNKWKKDEFYVCSRNVVFDKPDKKCYYDTNIYLEMAEKYNIEKVLKELAYMYDVEYVTLQGETYGAGVQKRDYGLKDSHDFVGFNLIFAGSGRCNPQTARDILKKYNIPWVPILKTNYCLPDTVDDILAIAGGPSAIDGKEREGIVFRSRDGKRSFKAVDNTFIMKYHG